MLSWLMPTGGFWNALHYFRVSSSRCSLVVAQYSDRCRLDFIWQLRPLAPVKVAGRGMRKLAAYLPGLFQRLLACQPWYFCASLLLRSG